jgi:bifunctional non-homologous end joining protein LigD
VARLEEYRRKRDPGRTPEPFEAGGGQGRRFVVQRHSARRLHYDLRLERNGALASWAVPKGLPLDPGSRRRAIHTEDHPLAYVDFAGVIPKGEYGAGVMDVYDTGVYEVLSEKRDGSLTVRLEGARLRGTWSLVPAALEGDERNWLLVRPKSEPARRPLEVYLPMLPTRADEPPRRGAWLHEVRWPGERVVARLHEGEALLTGRRGEETTERFPKLARDLGRGLRTFEVVVDGVVSDDVYSVFDLLELEGEPLLERPLRERRAWLEELVDPTWGTVRLSEGFDDPHALLEAARGQGLAGVVSKRLASRYVPGRVSPDWRAVGGGANEEPVESEREVRRGRRVVRLTRLDQLWWPELGIRKADVLDYYQQVAPALLPHLRRRPFTIKRHYNGPRSPFAWVKDVPPEAPEWLPTAPLPAKSRGGAIVRYPLIDDELALLWVVDFGAIDLHTWSSRVDRPDRPDWVLFDLDPAGVGFAEVVRAALLLRDALEALGLRSYVKTTGGEGLHVHVPVERRHSYEEAREFCDIVAGALAVAADGLVTRERVKAKRHGVYVDTKMNGHGQQVVSVYSLRPRPEPAVATPLEWDELHEGLDPAQFTLERVLDRVRRRGDLFAPVLRGGQRLSQALSRLA